MKRSLTILQVKQNQKTILVDSNELWKPNVQLTRQTLQTTQTNNTQMKTEQKWSHDFLMSSTRVQGYLNKKQTKSAMQLKPWKNHRVSSQNIFLLTAAWVVPGGAPISQLNQVWNLTIHRPATGQNPHQNRNKFNKQINGKTLLNKTAWGHRQSQQTETRTVGSPKMTTIIIQQANYQVPITSGTK